MTADKSVRPHFEIEYAELKNNLRRNYISVGPTSYHLAIIE